VLDGTVQEGRARFTLGAHRP